MKNATKEKLVSVACKNATFPYHGFVNSKNANIEPMVKFFPKWNIESADNNWCAAFVYFCLIEAGFDIPYSPDECVTCSLCGCGGFEEFAIGDKKIEYHKRDEDFPYDIGDIVIFDKVFNGNEHDHIGILVGIEEDYLVMAEGNIPGTNTSGIIKRKLDEHIRCFIRIPDGYSYNRD